MPGDQDIQSAGAVRGPDDVIQPFTVEATGVRGRLMRAGPLVDDILTRHAYPEPVARLLGEMLVLAGLLSSMLKYQGIFTLQIRADGPVALMVADLTSEGRLRGYAEFDAARVAEAESAAEGARPPLSALLGEGTMAYTVDHGASERYQGIVELRGETLADCLRHYFLQSEQIATGVHVALARVREADGVERWRAGGMLLQRLAEEAEPAAGEALEDEEAWRRAMILMSTCTDAELCDPSLTPHELLYRLFHEDGVRVFRERPLEAHCRCSREKVARVLASLPPEEVEDLKDDGVVVVTCQFCSATYRFDDADLAQLHGT